MRRRSCFGDLRKRLRSLSTTFKPSSFEISCRYLWNDFNRSVEIRILTYFVSVWIRLFSVEKQYVRFSVCSVLRFLSSAILKVSMQLHAIIPRVISNEFVNFVLVWILGALLPRNSQFLYNYNCEFCHRYCLNVPENHTSCYSHNQEKIFSFEKNAQKTV